MSGQAGSVPSAPWQPVDPRVRPSGWWYLTVVVLWLAAAGLSGSVVVTVVQLVSDGLTPVSTTRTITVPAAGVTVYAADRPSTPDCVLAGRGGQISQMPGLPYHLTATYDGTTVWAVANTPVGLAPGDYAVTCPGVGPTSLLWTGDRLPVGSVVARSVVAVGCGVLGLVALVVLLVRRHRSRARIRDHRRMVGAGYGGWPGPPWPAGGAPPTPYGAPPYPPYGASPYPPYDERTPPG